ncbi:hypothetical protein L484_015841 [Morus notabilis]|uniref:Uncharacterized protein n=1 Tax=Morus notabilis TaxID=981085 RepID=W9RP90_9ROSA|nr:hypothetical protein L484_015841 [Morus notabilis]
MAKAKPKILASLLILLNFFFAACAIQESRSQVALPYRERISDIFSPTQKESLFQRSEADDLVKGDIMKWSWQEMGHISPKGVHMGELWESIRICTKWQN